MLVTIEQLRIAAGLDPTDATQDTEIMAVYAVALAMIENYCDRKFELLTSVEIFVHVAGYSLSLQRYPLQAIVSVVVIENTMTPPYHADFPIGVIYFDGRTVSHEITVQYTGGYDDTTCPADLQWALLRVFKTLTAENAGTGTGIVGPVKQAKIGDLAISFDTGNASSSSDYDSIITPVLVNILANYKRWSA